MNEAMLHRLKVMDVYELPDVISFFEAYLNDEVAVIYAVHPSAVKKKAKLKKVMPQKKPAVELSLDETDAMLASMALMGELIIRKYCKGEYPHFERMNFWDISLQTVARFVEAGILREGREFDYYRNGLAFRCLAFDTANTGELVLPLDMPVAASCTEDMPEICARQFEGLTKKMARDIIIKYARENQLRVSKWQYMYILRCADDTLYTGCTHDIWYCMRMHQKRKAGKYTKSRLPVRIVYWEAFHTEQEAMDRAQQVKGYKRARKLRLIKGCK